MVAQASNPVYQVRPWMITPEQERDFKKTDVTSEWLRNLPDQTVQQYAGKWIAAKDESIIAAGNTLDELLDILGQVDLQTVIISRMKRPWYAHCL